jgi:hypothetical protein
VIKIRELMESDCAECGSPIWPAGYVAPLVDAEVVVHGVVRTGLEPTQSLETGSAPGIQLQATYRLDVVCSDACKRLFLKRNGGRSYVSKGE